MCQGHFWASRLGLGAKVAGETIKTEICSRFQGNWVMDRWIVAEKNLQKIGERKKIKNGCCEKCATVLSLVLLVR